MRRWRAGGAAAVFLAVSALILAGDAVVLRGGARIQIRGPIRRDGNTVFFTRSDGTLFSVPASEVDFKATSALKVAPAAKTGPAIAAPLETPAQAARATREGPKARVRLTDADVGHQLDMSQASSEKKEESGGPSSAHIEVADYSQEKSGGRLVVRGTLRNVGNTSAQSVRMVVTAVDEKGEPIGTGDGSLATGSINPGNNVAFSASVPVGDKVVASLRFQPQWIATPPAAPAGSGGAATAASQPASGSMPGSSSGASASGSPSAPRPAAAPPAPTPLPYGQGVLYAAPPPSAPSEAPPDGAGYIPGAASPENQPKPPK